MGITVLPHIQVTQKMLNIRNSCPNIRNVANTVHINLAANDQVSSARIQKRLPFLPCLNLALPQTEPEDVAKDWRLQLWGIEDAYVGRLYPQCAGRFRHWEGAYSNG